MKYGTTLIVLSIVNFATIFSGFPPQWKSVIITLTSIIILFIGWVLRALAQKKKMRAEKRVIEIQKQYQDSLDETVEELTQTIAEQVEKKLD